MSKGKGKAKAKTWTAIIEEGDSPGWYVAHCPELGTASQGATPDEAFENLKEATELYLETVSGSVVERASVREFVLV